MLEIDRLNQSYGGSHILRDTTFSLGDGSVTALMGRNGVGKTTLLKCVLGFLPVTSGSMHFNGTDLAALNTERRIREGIGYVPQGRMIFPLLTVAENLRVALAARTDGCREIPDHVFTLFPVLAEMLDRRGGDLSGGQQQQLAIGRALVQEPRLLILDEPCEGIQPSVVQQIAEVITELNRSRKITILVVEQRLSFVKQVASQFAIMERGSVQAGGSIEALTDELVNQYLVV